MITFKGRKAFLNTGNNRRTGTQQAADFAQARGIVMIPGAYAYRPMQIADRDRGSYVRVAPDGPFDQAWQGVQKMNAVARVGTHYQDIPNPLQTNRMHIPRVMRNNPGAFSIGGGPLSYTASQSEAANPYNLAPANPTLSGVLKSRLKGWLTSG